jgi:MFS family permease
LLNANLRWFLLGMVLANIASVMVFTILSVYLADLGASVSQIGIVYSVASIVPLVLQVIGGWLSDSIGRLRTVALGSLVAVFGYLGFWLAPTWQWVLVALAFEYVSGSLVGPSFGAYVADESDVAQRGRVFGLAQSIFMIVLVVGPPLAGWLSDQAGFKLTLLLAFILYLLATVLRIWMAFNKRFDSLKHLEPPTWAGFRGQVGGILALLISGGVLTWILITDGVGDISWRLSDALQPIYLTDVLGLSITQFGILHAVVGLVVMLVTLGAGWLSDRTSERLTITLGFLLQFAGLALFVTLRGFYGMLLVAVVLGAGFGMIGPAYDALISKVVPERMRGLAYGFFRSSLGVISLPAPWLGAQLWDRFSPRAPFILTAIASLGSAVLAWLKFRLPPTEMESESTSN